MDLLKDLSLDSIRNAAEDAFNQAKPKSDTEARVYDVLSHKNWGSSSTEMNQIARDTYDSEKFAVITRIMWEAMENQRPAAWRVVFKGLTLLEYLIKNGSERCVDDARNHSHTLRSLFQFNYYEGTIDRGLGVREKSKQLVEMLSDDNMIREERQKAKKLREKFGGNLGGVGGGGSQYAGYGNDSFSGGGGGGYGDGGLDRSGGGYGGDSRSSGYGGDSGGGGYSGRYSDGHDAPSSGGGGASTTPTFATIPEDKPRKSKTKKKKKKAVEAPAPAAEPEIDLFSFDAPAPAPAAAASDDHGFDAFQSAPTQAATAPTIAAPPQAAAPTLAAPPQATAPAAHDPFGDFSGPSAAPPQQNAQFDAFGTNNSAMMGAAAMNSNNMFGAQQQQQPMMNGSGMMGQAQLSMSSTAAVAGSTQAPPANDDDFGDFEDASPKKATVQSSDPLDRLIQLDSLTKNTKKKEDKLNEPVIATPAAHDFVTSKQQIQQVTQSSNAAASFQGLDGLNKTTNFQPKAPVSTLQPGRSIMSEGTEKKGTSELIGMMSPEAMMPQQQSQQQQQNAALQQQMMMQQQMAMQQQMMMNQQQQQAQMGGGQMGGSGMMNMQGGGMPNQMMGNPQMMGGQQPMGGMMNPNMQSAGGMPGMGGMHGMGGMQGMGMGGSMQGGMQGGNMMGAQQMGGQQSGASGQMGGQPMGGGWQ